MMSYWVLFIGIAVVSWPVSYTHLDVYKRQDHIFASDFIRSSG